MAQILKQYPEDVRLVYRHFPLASIHDKALLAAQASEAAGKQGQFWELHDLLFERQAEWKDFAVADFETWLVDKAGELGLDTARFQTDLNSEELVKLASQSWERGQEIGMPGTPFLLIDYQIWPNNLPMTAGNIAAVIELKLLERSQFTACPPLTIDASKEYIATLKTEKGDIRVALFPDKAPITVNSFVFLARSGWYDNVTFHRVLPGTVAQTGDPSGTGFGGPGYAFINENADMKFDREGLVAMANSGPDTNGSQFFFTYGAAPQWDGGYTIFGEVISGMDVIQQLTARDPSRTLDLPPGDKILSVTVEER
jgi:cyclophilin family peptidyl-prolyl cis-trans isomerase